MNAGRSPLNRVLLKGKALTKAGIELHYFLSKGYVGEGSSKVCTAGDFWDPMLRKELNRNENFQRARTRLPSRPPPAPRHSAWETLNRRVRKKRINLATVSRICGRGAMALVVLRMEDAS